MFSSIDKKGQGHLSLTDVKQFAIETRPDLQSREHVIELAFKQADESGVSKYITDIRLLFLDINIYIVERFD